MSIISACHLPCASCVDEQTSFCLDVLLFSIRSWVHMYLSKQTIHCTRLSLIMLIYRHSVRSIVLLGPTQHRDLVVRIVRAKLGERDQLVMLVMCHCSSFLRKNCLTDPQSGQCFVRCSPCPPLRSKAFNSVSKVSFLQFLTLASHWHAKVRSCVQRSCGVFMCPTTKNNDKLYYRSRQGYPSYCGSMQLKAYFP